LGGGVESGGVAGAVCCASGSDDRPKFVSGVEPGGPTDFACFRSAKETSLVGGFVSVGFTVDEGT